MRKTILLAIAMYCNMAVAQMVPLMQQEMDVMKDHSNEILGRALYLADEATMQTHLLYRAFYVKKSKTELLPQWLI